MRHVEDLPADANARVERWMLSRFRLEHRDRAPISWEKTLAHLLCCLDATAGPVDGGGVDISEVTAGGAIYLETVISCPHGQQQTFVYSEQGDLAGIIAELDDPNWQEIGPPPIGLPGYFHLWCPTCNRSVASHRLRPGMTSRSRMDHDHPVELVVIQNAVEVERRALAPRERYEVQLP